jgi:hypothetical protein
MNYQDIKFSEFYSEKRITLANDVIGKKMIKWIIAFALYLCGASRKAAAESQNLSYDTFKSLTQRIEKEGLSAFFDKRFTATPTIKQKPILKAQAGFYDDYLIINLGITGLSLKIPAKNSIQIKTVLFSLYENNLLDKHIVSDLSGYSPLYTQRLNKKLQENDAAILIDNRQGQKTDYVVTPEIKAEIIQQYAANTATCKKTSSQALSADLKERCNIDLPARTIRLHIKKLGLSKIKQTLPGLIESLKKTQTNNCEK